MLHIRLLSTYFISYFQVTERSRDYGLGVAWTHLHFTDRKRCHADLQPSSFTDLLELLPGGYAQTPSLTGVNAIRLREASTSALSNYETSSLGTAFVIDGVSQNEDGQPARAGYFQSRRYSFFCK